MAKSKNVQRQRKRFFRISKFAILMSFITTETADTSFTGKQKQFLLTVSVLCKKIITKPRMRLRASQYQPFIVRFS